MVSYLKKPTGSEGFKVIEDFLNDSHIRYALTKNPTIYVSLIEQLWQTATVRTVDNEEQEITATVDGKEFTVTEGSIMRYLQLADADAEGEGSGHPSEPKPPPSTTQPTNEEPIPNVLSSSHQKTQTPRQALNKSRCQEAIRGSIAQTRSERVPTPSYDSPLFGVHTPRSEEERFKQHELTGNVKQQSSDPPFSRGHTLGSGEDNIELIKELMKTCTKLSERVLALEESKTVQDLVITRLKLRVKKLEKKKKKARIPQPMKRRLFKVRVESFAKENLDEEDPSKQGRSMIKEINQDVGVTLVQINAKDQGRFNDETDFDADAARKNVQTYTRRKAVSTGSGGISIASRLFSTAEESVIKDKGKGKMKEYEDEHTKRTKLQQEQVRLGHEAPVRLQEDLDEEERQRMARRLQAEERNKYNKVDQEKMLVDLINQKKRYFATQRAKAKRNKPMTQAQQRTYMSNYIKNMRGYTLHQLRGYSFDEIKELFDTTMKIINTFVPIETEVRGRASKLVTGSSQAKITNFVKVGSSKRTAEAELNYEGSKRQKTNEASRVSNHTDQFFKDMLKAFNKDDLVMLWSLVKERFSLTKPTNDKERTLWVELKRLFEPDTDDTLWKL
nr:hypothetical protein [Tanacetum cinerariifolium]GEW15936.1 hypothetical protein [Tanacetum cinerariifolium]